MAHRIKTATTMIASKTGLSAVPRVSLPKLTRGPGSTLMINSPTAGTGEPDVGATNHAAMPAIPKPASPATAPASRAHHRVARAASRSSCLCTSPSCAAASHRTTCPCLRIPNSVWLASVVYSKSLDSRRRPGGCLSSQGDARRRHARPRRSPIAVFYGRRRERSGAPPGRRIPRATSDARH